MNNEKERIHVEFDPMMVEIDIICAAPAARLGDAEAAVEAWQRISDGVRRSAAPEPFQCHMMPVITRKAPPPAPWAPEFHTAPPGRRRD